MKTFDVIYANVGECFSSPYNILSEAMAKGLSKQMVGKVVAWEGHLFNCTSSWIKDGQLYARLVENKQTTRCQHCLHVLVASRRCSTCETGPYCPTCLEEGGHDCPGKVIA